MSDGKTADRAMPKGERKGGTRYPRMRFSDAIKNARKLVSKTHTSPQSQESIIAVVGAKGPKGEIKMSALRQYGFLEGKKATNFTASELAKRIASAPEDELLPLLREAALKPTIFRAIFDVFHGEEVTKAKLKQRASELDVHPDLTDDCVETYLSAVTDARLATVTGDRIRHVSETDLAETANTGSSPIDGDALSTAEEDKVETGEHGTAEQGGQGDEHATGKLKTSSEATPRAVFHVNVSLDSSLDTEKLEKQLALLKRFGAI
jgi:hypothetical protein